MTKMSAGEPLHLGLKHIIDSDFNIVYDIFHFQKNMILYYILTLNLEISNWCNVQWMRVQVAEMWHADPVASVSQYWPVGNQVCDSFADIQCSLFTRRSV